MPGAGTPVPAYVALLRGINVAGRHRVPMAGLRACAEALGWDEPRTHLQSGNLVFRTDAGVDRLEAALEGELARHLDVRVPVIIRSAAAWNAIVDGNPLAEVADAEPRRLMLGLGKEPLAADVESELTGRVTQGEVVRRVDEALWIHFPAGVGTSKLTPKVLDRAAGSPLTLRNWSTVIAVRELLAGLTAP